MAWSVAELSPVFMVKECATQLFNAPFFIQVRMIFNSSSDTLVLSRGGATIIVPSSLLINKLLSGSPGLTLRISGKVTLFTLTRLEYDVLFIRSSSADSLAKAEEWQVYRAHFFEKIFS